VHADESNESSSEDEPGSIEPKTQDGHSTRNRQGRSCNVYHSRPTETPSDDGHERKRGDINPVQKGSSSRRATQPGHQRAAQYHKDECGQENPTGCHHRAYRPTEHIANEGGRGEDRTGRDLADRDRIEEL
jgi:hypothetical protein